MLSKLKIYILRRKLKNNAAKIVNSHINYEYDINQQFAKVNKALKRAINTFVLIIENKNSDRAIRFYTYGFASGCLRYCQKQMIDSTEHWYDGLDPHIHKKDEIIDILQFDPLNQIKFAQITILRKETISILKKFNELINNYEKKDWDNIKNE